MGIVGYDQVYISVKTGAGIPAGALGKVFEPYGKCVALSLFLERRCVDRECVISVRPVACFFSVDVDTGMAHGSIEYQCTFFSVCIFGDIESKPVPAGSYEG